MERSYMEVIPRGTNPGLDRQLDRLCHLDREIRGSFLAQAIAIERLIEDIISQYFCPEPDRRNLLFSLVLNGSDLTFSSKIKVLGTLLRLRCPDLLKAHPQLTEDLSKVRQFRNRLAHAMLDTSEEVLGKDYSDQIQLIFWENGQAKTQVISKADIQERLAACTRLVLTLGQIQGKVSKR